MFPMRETNIGRKKEIWMERWQKDFPSDTLPPFPLAKIGGMEKSGKIFPNFVCGVSGWVGSHCLHVMELKSKLEKLFFSSNIYFKCV